MRRRIALLSLLCLAALPAAQALAQAYPNRAIKFVVPFPAGGAVDALIRPIAQRLAEQYGVPVLVENRPGAAGNIGAGQVAKAEPDGYTLVAGTVGTHAINAAIYANLGFHPVRDFAPITINAIVPNVLIVDPALPARTLAELIAYAKAHPGALDYGSAGPGAPSHLAGEMFREAAGLDIVHVPYRGLPQATTDLIAGRLKMIFNNLPSALPFMQTGQARPLAVTTARRSPAAPDVPTMQEAGLPGYVVDSWYGIFAPAGTPADIVSKLNRDIVAALKHEEVAKVYRAQGAEIVGDSPEEARDVVARDTARWADVVARVGLKME